VRWFSRNMESLLTGVRYRWETFSRCSAASGLADARGCFDGSVDFLVTSKGKGSVGRALHWPAACPPVSAGVRSWARSAALHRAGREAGW
jgi:hypothetical protein